MTILAMKDLDLKGKRVLIREDLNVPVQGEVVVNDARIRASLPTIKLAMDQGAKVILMSHLGRPKEGVPIAEQHEFSMQPVAVRLAQVLGTSVKVLPNMTEEDTRQLQEGECVMMENVRINEGEKANMDALAQYYASLCDVFVMDAFGTAHRAQASTHGVAKYAPVACAGPLLSDELHALHKALAEPDRPMLAVVGGAKVSSKLQVLEALSAKVDHLIVGGGIANTFLAAAGSPVGASLHEKDMIGQARALMEKTHIPLPTDVVVAKELSKKAEARIKPVDKVESDDMILDVGPDTIQAFSDIIGRVKTILWNGPVGVFEFDPFSAGTEAVARAIADNPGFSIAGGGETVTAIEKYQVGNGISYISTGGGAFLEFVQGETLPAVAVLEERGKQHAGG